MPRARAIRILSLFDLQARADAAVDRKSEPVPPRTDRVVKTTVFLMRGSGFAEVNRICAGYFPNGKFPARTTVVIAGLPHPDFLLEIECEAVLE